MQKQYIHYYMIILTLNIRLRYFEVKSECIKLKAYILRLGLGSRREQR